MELLKYTYSLNGHTDRVWCVSWNFKGNLLASCSGDRSIRIWSYSKSLRKWECVCVLDSLHNKTVRCVAWSPCGNYLASSGFDGIVYIEQLCNKYPIEFESVTNLTSHNYEVKSVSWSISGLYLATCARDKMVYIWDLDDYNSPECDATLDSHTQDVKSVQWHPIVDILVSTSYDNSIKIYKRELDDWTVSSELLGHSSTVWKADFNYVGNILASCSDDRTIRLWVSTDISFSQWISAAIIDGYHERTIYDLSWAPHSNLLASVGADNSIFVFQIADLPDGDQCTTSNFDCVSTVRQAHPEDINCCSWQPTGDRYKSSLLATGSDDFSVKLWRFIDPDMPID